MKDNFNRPEAYHHFKLIRENPDYRLELMMIDLEAEHCPSIAQNTEPSSKEVTLGQPWSARQWGRVQQLQGEVNHLLSKLNEHIDKAKKARKDRL